MERNARRDKMKELRALICQHHEESTRSKNTLANISKMQERARQEKVPSSSSLDKLKNLYDVAIQEADKEAEILRKALERVIHIQVMQNEERLASKSSEGPKEHIPKGALMNMVKQRGSTLPLWLGKPNENPPPLCGAIPAKPNHIAKVGDMVAAWVKIPNKEDTWILAEVTKYDTATNKYEVDDIDEEQQDKHVVSRRSVIPLPLYRPNPETHPQALFPKDSVVLALYPQTTCFYKAIVKDPPSKPQEDYQVLFEDSAYPSGYSCPYPVCQQYVINFKEGRKK